jgi:transmembrane sensor
MNSQQAKELLKKYNNGTASEDEKNLVESWFLNLKSNQSDHGLSDEVIDRNTNEVWSSLKAHLPRRSVRLWPRIVAAAAIAVVIFGAGLWYFGDKRISNDGQEIADVRPGKNGATLTLANGNKIYISDNKAGKLADESGVSISKTADGQIVYTVVNQDGQSSNAINTLQTSNGEQTQIRLPDGTVVYLNSASSLRYPASFTKLSKRTVELSGEGYFKVSKDKSHPFIVKTGKQDVEVLGTEFNINSYANEPVIRTTLLEGSVKVSGENNVAKILKPNQQAVNSAKGIEVLDVEAQFFVDWKEGFFMFNNEDLESIMNRLSRWYNVKVVYADPSLKSKTFVGTISKYENISRVIDVLEGTGLATFRINKNLITISVRK